MVLGCKSFFQIRYILMKRQNNIKISSFPKFCEEGYEQVGLTSHFIGQGVFFMITTYTCSTSPCPLLAQKDKIV